MSGRFKCDFKDCRYNQYIIHCTDLCYICGHSVIWHSKRLKTPTEVFVGVTDPNSSIYNGSASYTDRRRSR